MRQGSNNGRRPRGRTNRKQHSGGPSRSHTFDSNGPDGRVRGNARQVYEKYLTLARDAQSSGDRIAAEAYFQHAEHYFRILSDSTDPHRPERRQDDRQPVQNNPAESAGDAPRGEAAIRVNGEAEGTGPQPDLPIDAGGDKRNGTAAEVSPAPAAAPETDQEAKPAAPKRRGRPRKPRPDDQDAKSRQEDSSSEKENDPAAP